MSATKRLPCLLTLVVLFFGGAAFCCNWPAVQGVIDWGQETKPFPKIDILQDVHKQKWDVRGAFNADNHAAIDDAVFMPPTGQRLGDNVVFRNLTIAALVRNCSVSCLTVYYWADVNNNGIADRDDKVLANGVWVQQSWKELIHLDSSQIRSNAAFNLFERCQAEGSGEKLRSGVSYLLLIRVFADQGAIDSWQFAGDIDTNGFPGRVVIKDVDCVTTTWAVTSNPAWGDLLGNSYSQYPARDVPTHWSGIDDREILWIRINQPPAAPFPRRP